jgi:hypothetical protein
MNLRTGVRQGYGFVRGTRFVMWLASVRAISALARLAA